MRQRDHAFTARLGPAHGLAEVAREPDDDELLRAERALGAEAAADVRSDDAQLARLGPERRPRSPCWSRCGTWVESHAVVRPSESTSAAADRTSSGQAAMRVLTIVSETTTSQPVEQVLVVLGGAGAAGDVRLQLGEEQHLVLRGLDGIDDDGQRVVVDDHELRRIRAGHAVLAQDDRDDVADEADDVLRDDRAPHTLLEHRNRRRPRRHAVQIGAGEDLHVRQRLRRGGVEAVNARVREQRTHESDVQCPLERQVLDVGRLPPQEAWILLSQHAISEDAHDARA